VSFSEVSSNGGANNHTTPPFAAGRQETADALPPCRYEHADGLVGVYREQVENSSRTLTLDLSKVRWGLDLLFFST
jgi:hypothetical protein